MTRINCIPPSELTDRHLLAEYRELPRVFKLARYSPDIPEQYTLGKGHVKFFYDKLSYCFNRQCEIVREMKRRGFKPKLNPDYLYDTYAHSKFQLWGSWVPTEEAQQLNRQRIKERLK